MARVSKTPPYITRLARELHEKLGEVGITGAKVEFRNVPATKLFRFRVVAAGFRSLTHSERQELVWRMVGQTLAAEQQLFISSILTLTPSEASGAAAA